MRPLAAEKAPEQGGGIPRLKYRRPWLYDKQRAAIFTDARYAVVEACPGAGMTVACIVWLAEQAMLAPDPLARYLWIAPDAQRTQRVFTRFAQALPRSWFDVDEKTQSITAANGAVIRFKPADRPGDLYEENINAAVIIEAQACREESWHALRMVLGANNGPARIAGRRRGTNNWFYQLARATEAEEKKAGVFAMHHAIINAADAIEAGVLHAETVEEEKRLRQPADFAELYLLEGALDTGMHEEQDPVLAEETYRRLITQIKDFDFKNPDYAPVFHARNMNLSRIRAEPQALPLLKAYYREHPADFLTDWGITFDPRNVRRGLPALIPFVLFPRQREWVEWVLGHWKAATPGLTEKSRDMGISWLAIGLSCALALFHYGVAIGFGSKKEELVDNKADPKSLFEKGRLFLSNLPEEFRGGWIQKDHSPHMRLIFPDTGSNITGEAGDNIGRGDRKSIYFVDEAAHLDRPALIEQSLSQTTDCRIDMSSVFGMSNPFAEKRWGGKMDVFIFDWREDPRKDDAWYVKQKAEKDELVIAQEIDRNYNASMEGIVIPHLWIMAAIDAHIKLGITPTGQRSASLDVADEGRDKNAFCVAHGILVEQVYEWSGKGDDIFGTVQTAFDFCDAHALNGFKYDADGLGAGVRGDARIINEKRAKQSQKIIDVEAFRGSEGVIDPDKEDVKGRINKDFFANRKAQSWWSLRMRFQKTYRWVVENMPCNPDEIISISSGTKLYLKLVSELSQPTYAINNVGKIVIDKAPDGAVSPNLGDSTMIQFSKGGHVAMQINTAVLARI